MTDTAAIDTTAPLGLGPAASESSTLDITHLADALREGTKSVHHEAENSPFVKRFTKGEISIGEHGRYLISLYFVYKTLENLLDEHKDNPAIKAIYFPDELRRLDALAHDLEYYYGKDGFDRVTDPATMTPAVKAYVDAMENAAKIDPALLVAHSYTRYLGDLSGGLILAKRFKKFVLGVKESEDVAEGLDFYTFDNVGNAKAFKTEYREQLNAIPVTQETKERIVAEAIHCFQLNIAVFDEVQKLSDEGKLLPTVCN
ncbi:hypothetical protein BX666DRAFT_2147126 [Dichotomocladium elegans]|nr:hypothetical protein BX666DRAFT_2147126 [Dichotomocladium elegans]